MAPMQPQPLFPISELVVDGNNEILGVVASAIPVDESDNPIITNLGFDSSTRQLTLTGSATAAQYQQVLRTLTYFNASDVVTTSDRTISVTISDAELPAETSSATADITVNVETNQAVIDEAVIQKYIADNNITNVQTDGALHYVIHEPGTGLNPTLNDFINVDYVGNLIVLNEQNDLVVGPVFDANNGLDLPLSGVIRGWQVGLQKLRTGGSATLLIPSSLAYGSTGNNAGDFANEVLLFDVTLNRILV